MTMRRFRVILLSAGVLTAGAVPAAAQRVQTGVVFTFAAQQLQATYNSTSTSEYPRYTEPDGSWWNSYATGSWTSGFFPQCLWAMYERTGDSTWRTRAQNRTAPIEPEKYNTGTHDVGFEIFNSFGYGYELTGSTSYKNVCLTAANSLATRYNATVGAIRSWDFQEPFPVIIDNMMNLELLFWASENGGPSSHHDKAVQHALTTRREHVRADGSSFHVVDFNPTTGDAFDWRTHQGYSDDSTWARGQAWGMYGFTMTYRFTNDSTFLDTAQLMSDWYIDHLPADFVPYYDFDAPLGGSPPRDTSAAAVAASGLLELAGFVTGEDRIRYIEAAESTLLSLAGPSYLANHSGNDAIILHGTYNYNSNKGVDAGLIWGDSYFLEALMRYDDLMDSLIGGDADCDGDVDLDDFVVMKNNWGSGDRWTEADFDGNGTVDLDDFTQMKNNWGSAAVPEPASMCLLVFGGLGLLAKRRRN